MGAKPRLKRDLSMPCASVPTRWLSRPRWRDCSTRGGGPETSEIAGGGNRASTHAEKKIPAQCAVQSEHGRGCST